MYSLVYINVFDIQVTPPPHTPFSPFPACCNRYCCLLTTHTQSDFLFISLSTHTKIDYKHESVWVCAACRIVYISRVCGALRLWVREHGNHKHCFVCALVFHFSVTRSVVGSFFFFFFWGLGFCLWATVCGCGYHFFCSIRFTLQIFFNFILLFVFFFLFHFDECQLITNAVLLTEYVGIKYKRHIWTM